MPPIRGRRTDGPATARAIKQLGNRLVPPDPSQLVQTVTVPSPPRLPLELSGEEYVRRLGLAYVGAVGVRTGRYSRPPSDSPRLRQCGALLAELEIPPAAWCLFAADVWRETAGKKGPPPANFTFSEGMITKHFEWFEEQRDRYTGVRVVVGAAHRQLVLDWNAMQDDLMSAFCPYDPPTESEVATVVERHFPLKSYETRLLNAKAEALRMQTNIDQQVRDGGFPWLG
jgi:hypothetical protein